MGKQSRINSNRLVIPKTTETERSDMVDKIVDEVFGTVYKSDMPRDSVIQSAYTNELA